MLIDTHAHLCDEKLINEADEIIGKLAENNVEIVFEIGADLKSSADAVALAEKYENIYATVGMHPQDTDTFTKADIESIRELALSSNKVKAIGEIGLDYHYDYDKDRQKELFILQLDLACDLHLPVVLHLRDAYEDMYNILVEYKSKLKYGVLLHCYCGSKEMITQFSFLDPYYAFGGAITFKNNNRAEVIKAVKRDRLLVETDCPYMTPVPYRGKINTPLNLHLIASKMAEDLDIGYEELMALTTANAKRFFNV